jgi:1-acyl-sn-glycerol-3-phosphate acyltransferase
MANAKSKAPTQKTARKSTAKKPIGKRPAQKAAPKKRRASPALAVVENNAPRECLNGPDPELMEKQSGLWNQLMNRYFRLEIDGFDKLPEEPCLLVGVHSGGPLTMDAWTVLMAWWRNFGESRNLHATAHDVLMKSPVLGQYFRRLGVITPTRENIQAAFDKGDDVVLWPGGELDSYRNWSDRDKAVLGGRKGFIRMAMRSGVPIVPVATIGGHDTLFVLSEGRGLAKLLNLKERMRSEVAPITLSWPLGLSLHLTPFQHIPLPAKIRTEMLEPIYLDSDPARLDDQKYVDGVYDEIESRIQAAMDKLAKKRRFPIFG